MASTSSRFPKSASIPELSGIVICDCQGHHAIIALALVGPHHDVTLRIDFLHDIGFKFFDCLCIMQYQEQRSQRFLKLIDDQRLCLNVGMKSISSVSDHTPSSDTTTFFCLQILGYRRLARYVTVTSPGPFRSGHRSARLSTAPARSGARQNPRGSCVHEDAPLESR